MTVAQSEVVFLLQEVQPQELIQSLQGGQQIVDLVGLNAVAGVGKCEMGSYVGRTAAGSRRACDSSSPAPPRCPVVGPGRIELRLFGPLVWHDLGYRKAVRSSDHL